MVSFVASQQLIVLSDNLVLLPLQSQFLLMAQIIYLLGLHLFVQIGLLFTFADVCMDEINFVINGSSLSLLLLSKQCSQFGIVVAL